MIREKSKEYKMETLGVVYRRLRGNSIFFSLLLALHF